MTLLGSSGPLPGGPGRRRSWVGTAVFVVIAMAVLFAAALGITWYLRGDSTTPEASPSSSAPRPCTTVTLVPGTGLPKPGQVTVNVYNATTRPGLAADTSTVLKSRGFVVGKVANDPLQKTITAPAEIRHGATGLAGAQLAAYYVPGAILLADPRTDATVDVVLGTGFTSVAGAKAVQRALTQPTPVASGPGCSPTAAPSTAASSAPASSGSTTGSRSASPAAS
ncbi:MAG: LytR family transcriptional regulator [Actinomycetota bacterium]|nr:MAG: LytR family transcriptional regulator [Actinomycetota bacterium]